MSFALLFSGQGTQHAGMFPWLIDDERVVEMRQRLGIIDWRRSLDDAHWAQNNANAQTLLTGLALAAWNQLKPMVAPPAAIAGYSVGELAAFSAAGVLDSADANALAPLRASAMDRCASEMPGGLLAISGVAPDTLRQVIAQTGLAVAIRNGVDSVVLGGPESALDTALPIALQAGAHCTRLRVAVASHTRWMLGAAESFAHTLSGITFHSPTTLLFSNSADRIRDAATAKTALAAQIAQTVRWDECMENIATRQVTCVLELGPGQALTRMWNQRHASIPARASDDFRSASAIAAWLRSNSRV